MANRIDIATHRDSHLEFERLMRELPLLTEDALQMAMKIHPQRFRNIGPDLREYETGEKMEEIVGNWRKTNPQDFADFIPDDPQQVLHTYITEAFGEQCSPKTLGRLFTFMKDPKRYEALAKAWGCDTARMIPGKRPGTDEGVKKAVPDQDANSPFNPKRNYLSEATRREDIAKFLARHGTKVARAHCEKFQVDIAGRKLGAR